MKGKNAKDEQGVEEQFYCACHAEQLIATRWMDDDEEMYLTMWSIGLSRPPLWRWRFRQAWRSLRRGDPYTDSVILSKPDARRLGFWLLDASRDKDNGTANIGEPRWDSTANPA